MHVEKLELKNFGPFEELKLDLTFGSIAVCGKNGSGKSTILNALHALPTGDFGRFGGLKEENLWTRAAAGAKSYIAGTICHGGQRVQVKRWIPSKQELLADGEKPIVSERGVREKLEAFLGVDMEVISRYCFKQQDKLSDFLNEQPAVRAAAYHTLFKTGVCQTGWDVLNKVLTRDSAALGAVVDNTDELAKNLHEADTALTTLEAQRREHAGKLLNDKSLGSAAEIVAKHQRHCVAEEQAVQARRELEACTTALAPKAAAEEEARRKRDQQTARRVQAEQAAAGAVERLTTLRQLKTTRVRRDEVVTHIGTAQAALRKLVEPVIDKAFIETATQQIGALTSEMHAKNKQIGILEKTTTPLCPVCEAPIKDLPKFLDNLKREVAERVQQISALASAKQAAEEKVRSHDLWQRRQHELTTVLAGYERELNAMVETADLEVLQAEEADLTKKLETFKLTQSWEQEAARAHSTAQAGRAAMQTAVEMRQRDLAAAEQTLAETVVEPALFEKVQRRLAEHNEAEKAIAVLDGQALILRRVYDERKEALAGAQAQLRRQSKLRQVVADLTQVRDVLHRDQLPRDVARVNLARIEAEVNNDGLKLFGAPFWVETQDDLTFLVHKPAEPPLTQGRLSTGQRAILAIAFWSAVGTLWGQELGMLVLDEPTANLDEENRRYLGSALGLLTSRIRGNRQIVMATHDHALKCAFDQVIDLDELRGR